MASSRTLLAGAVAATAIVAAGCGSDGDATSSAPSTNAAPAVSVPTPTATAPATRPGTVESQPGGAGDEQANVVPATFKIDGNQVDPPDVQVPAFFTIRVTGQSADGQAHTITFQGQSAKVPAGGKGAFNVEGLKAGIYPVGVDGRVGAATITTGQEPGP